MVSAILTAHALKFNTLSDPKPDSQFETSSTTFVAITDLVMSVPDNESAIATFSIIVTTGPSTIEGRITLGGLELFKLSTTSGTVKVGGGGKNVTGGPVNIQGEVRKVSGTPTAKVVANSGFIAVAEFSGITDLEIIANVDQIKMWTVNTTVVGLLGSSTTRDDLKEALFSVNALVKGFVFSENNANIVWGFSGDILELVP